MTSGQAGAVLLVVLTVGSLGFALFSVVFLLCQLAAGAWRLICVLRARWSVRRLDERLDAARTQWTGVSTD